MFYRKYRPQTIGDLDSTKMRESLGQSLLSGKFASAYLLTGPRGIGKTTTARLIAKAICCQNRKPGEEPCNSCDACTSITLGNNLDVIEIDAASNTSVEDVRDLREKVKLAPSRGAYKVYIIDEVHMLSTAAFNALLKTLEEPPSHVTFVLATTDLQKVPETIKSRCQNFDFSFATTDEIVRSLERAVRGEQLEVSQDDLLKIAKMAKGSFRDGHKLLEQYINNDKKFLNESVDVQDFLKFLDDKNSEKALEWLKNYVDKNLPIDRLIENCVEVLRADILNLTPQQIIILKKLNQVYGELKDSVSPSLPLEIAIVEYCGEPLTANVEEPPMMPVKSEIKTEVKTELKPEPKLEAKLDAITADVWKRLLEEAKPYNHSLTAVLRSAKPIGLSGDTATVAVKYKFHIDKLMENQNRQVVEKLLSGIMGKQIKITYKLEGV